MAKNGGRYDVVRLLGFQLVLALVRVLKLPKFSSSLVNLRPSKVSAFKVDGGPVKVEAPSSVKDSANSGGSSPVGPTNANGVTVKEDPVKSISTGNIQTSGAYSAREEGLKRENLQINKQLVFGDVHGAVLLPREMELEKAQNLDHNFKFLTLAKQLRLRSSEEDHCSNRAGRNYRLISRMQLWSKTKIDKALKKHMHESRLDWCIILLMSIMV